MIVSALLLILILVSVKILLGASLLHLLKLSLVLLVAAIPVAMPAVMSVTMALGALALSERNEATIEGPDRQTFKVSKGARPRSSWSCAASRGRVGSVRKGWSTRPPRRATEHWAWSARARTDNGSSWVAGRRSGPAPRVVGFTLRVSIQMAKTLTSAAAYDPFEATNCRF